MAKVEVLQTKKFSLCLLAKIMKSLLPEFVKVLYKVSTFVSELKVADDYRL
jgi:hypothetical protein